MAKLRSNTITIELSKLYRDSDKSFDDELVSDETVAQLEAILAELMGGDVLIEVNKD